MNFFGSFYPTPRVVTFNKSGSVSEINGLPEAKPTKTSGGDTKASVDGVILLSTDAAAKITEKAVANAFDKWVKEMTETVKTEEVPLSKETPPPPKPTLASPKKSVKNQNSNTTLPKGDAKYKTTRIPKTDNHEKAKTEPSQTDSRV